MKKTISITAITIITILFSAFAPYSRAANISKEQINEYGYIDWISQKVYATGVGVAPEDKKNETQAKSLAFRAAVVVAQRNLLEVIKGVHIDSQTVIEKRISMDDRVISKIEGIIQYSQVEKSQPLENSAVAVTLSMPLFGKMGDVLIRAIEGVRKPKSVPEPLPDLESRLSNLEMRVQLLEERITGLRKISADQEAVRLLLTYLVEAWQDNADDLMAVKRAGFVSDEEAAALRNRLNDQDRRMAAISIMLNDISERLSELENSIDRRSTFTRPKTSTSTHPYTGLIVDARNIGFRPSLKPKIYGQSELLYPGDHLNLSEVIKNGYVRYYNNQYQAQQSERIGSLPYTAKATGTHDGPSSLSLGPEAFQILKAILQTPDNFLSYGRVVIIF